jgi:hypothetical protein
MTEPVSEANSVLPISRASIYSVCRCNNSISIGKRLRVFIDPTCWKQSLAAFARKEYEHLVPALEPATFLLGDIVYESGGPLDYLFSLR